MSESNTSIVVDTPGGAVGADVLIGKKIVSLIAWNRATGAAIARGIAWSARIVGTATGDVLLDSGTLTVPQLSLRRHPIVESEIAISMTGTDSVNIILERYIPK